MNKFVNYDLILRKGENQQCQYCVPFGTAQMKSIICQIITPAPGMKQVLEEPGSCGQYENYQMSDGFPVGKENKMTKMKIMMFCKLWRIYIKFDI